VPYGQYGTIISPPNASTDSFVMARIGEKPNSGSDPDIVISKEVVFPDI